jgi:hypothetical protein
MPARCESLQPSETSLSFRKVRTDWDPRDLSSVIQSQETIASEQYGARMADVIEIRVAALRRLAEQSHHQADPRLSLAGAEAANDAALGRPADLDEDSLHAFRGFAAAVAVGAVVWSVVGALVWLA